MIQRILWLGLMGLLMFVLGCSDDPASSTKRTTEIAFPDAIGNRWTYFYYDSLEGVSDTVDLHITGFTNLEGGAQAKVWQYTFRNLLDTAGSARVDSEFVQVLGDTIRIYRPNQPALVTILMPFVPGRQWTSGAQYNDTTVVADTGTQVGTPMGIIGSVARLERYWQLPIVTDERSDLWLAPDVGFVYKYFQVTELMPPVAQVSREVWVILNFQPAQ